MPEALPLQAHLRSRGGIFAVHDLCYYVLSTDPALQIHNFCREARESSDLVLLMQSPGISRSGSSDAKPGNQQVWLF